MSLKVDSIVKKYGEYTAVNNMSFEMTKPGVFALLGTNGAGKTTTIRIILGMLSSDSGSVTWNGKSFLAANEPIGYLAEERGLYPKYKIMDQLIYFASLKGMKRPEAIKALDYWFDRLNVNEYRNKRAEQLSKGNQQKIQLIAALAPNPELIILDEPTVAVDPQSRNRILEGITKLNKDGATIIYTSHYMEEVEQICSRIAIIDKGKNLALGTKEELKKMIKKSEIITIDIISLTSEDINAIKSLPHVYEVKFDEHKLTVLCNGGKHNLMRVLDYLQSKEYSFGHVHSELPSLNDVFLEITGKELRD